MCFYRRADVPSYLLSVADEHDTGIVVKPSETKADENGAMVLLKKPKPNGFSSDDGMTPEQRHKVQQRELFLTRQFETVPVTTIKGKCNVTLLNETESFLCYLGKDDAFFYSLVYDPVQKTLVADRGEIRVGTKYQAEPASVNVPPNGVTERQSKDLETLVWNPENPLADSEIDNFVTLAKSVGTFARASDPVSMSSLF
jgi:metastasis-associated protein MTA